MLKFTDAQFCVVLEGPPGIPQLLQIATGGGAVSVAAARARVAGGGGGAAAAVVVVLPPLLLAVLSCNQWPLLKQPRRA